MENKKNNFKAVQSQISDMENNKFSCLKNFKQRMYDCHECYKMITELRVDHIIPIFSIIFTYLIHDHFLRFNMLSNHLSLSLHMLIPPPPMQFLMWKLCSCRLTKELSKPK